MKTPKKISAMSAAASQLRAIVADMEDGAFLGGEGELQQTLGVSRTTLRQVARLLEREGLLTVKRGNNGGYYACRPSFASIEAGLTAYLEGLDVRIGELRAMASMTWSETVRQAAKLGSEAAGDAARELVKLVQSVDPDITYRELSKVEQHIRAAIFKLIDSPYLELIFQVNIQFAARKYEGRGQLPPEPEDQAKFVASWRSAKFLELEAIALGDEELGILASERTRRVWGAMVMLPADARA
jgi:GntR family transcriptional regulator, transcriptional repressor for pyruvate dehydrogenase complex